MDHLTVSSCRMSLEHHQIEFPPPASTCPELVEQPVWVLGLLMVLQHAHPHRIVGFAHLLVVVAAENLYSLVEGSTSSSELRYR
jgi:hypothetical protein